MRSLILKLWTTPTFDDFSSRHSFEPAIRLFTTDTLISQRWVDYFILWETLHRAQKGIVFIVTQRRSILVFGRWESVDHSCETTNIDSIKKSFTDLIHSIDHSLFDSFVKYTRYLNSPWQYVKTRPLVTYCSSSLTFGLDFKTYIFNFAPTPLPWFRPRFQLRIPISGCIHLQFL